MKRTTVLVSVFQLVLIVGCVANYAYFFGALENSPVAIFPSDLASNLLGLRFVVMMISISIFISIYLRGGTGIVLLLISLALMIGLHVLWYFDKYKWLAVIGMLPGTQEYSTELENIGWFRGANSWDMIALVGTVVSTLSILFVRGRDKVYLSERFIA